MIWYDMIWYNMIWYDMIWYDMIWYDMKWYNMIDQSMIWYDRVNVMILLDTMWHIAFCWEIDSSQVKLGSAWEGNIKT